MSEIRPSSAAKTPPIRERLIAEAEAIIDARGIEGLSMREVARRVGVSHQAPYKHFGSRDEIIAAIVARGFDRFAAHLSAQPIGGHPFSDLGCMGEAYVEFAARHPLHFRLMFSTELPDLTAHPGVADSSQRAFSILKAAIAKLPQTMAAKDPEAKALKDAVFVWSTIHGLSVLSQTDAFRGLDLSEALRAGLLRHTLSCIGAALVAPRSE